MNIQQKATKVLESADDLPADSGRNGSATQVGMTDFPVVGSADVALFWDFENVRIPPWCPATTASEKIRDKIAKYGRVVEKRLYYDSRQTAESYAPRSDLDLSGFTLVDCPSRNRKETLDKKLIVDVLCFAWERASLGAKACVVLITSDGDYSYALARLRDIGVFTVVVYRPDIVAKVLIDNANVVMSWEFDVLGGPPRQSDEEDEPSMSETISEATVLEQGKGNSDVTTEDQPQHEILVKQPNVQTRGKFALFCSVVLNAQYRNIHQGISVYSSWADESNVAATFYTKVGTKDRAGYLEIRTLATQKGFIEWGRRKVAVHDKPVVKVKDRKELPEGLSHETYLRLTYSGLAVLKPDITSKEEDWSLVLPRAAPRLRQETATDGSSASSTSGQGSPTKTPRKNVKLFVGGLAWETTEDSLRSYFKQFGPLDKV